MSFSRCFGEDTCITIPDIDAVVMVLQPSEPRITITGVERLNRPASDIKATGGVVLFQELHIISTVTRADATLHHTGMDCTTHSSKIEIDAGKVSHKQGEVGSSNCCAGSVLAVKFYEEI